MRDEPMQRRGASDEDGNEAAPPRRARRNLRRRRFSFFMPERRSDTIALAFVTAATLAVLINALLLQPKPTTKNVDARTLPRAAATTSAKVPNVAPPAPPVRPVSLPSHAPLPPPRPDVPGERTRTQLMLEDIRRALASGATDERPATPARLASKPQELERQPIARPVAQTGAGAAVDQYDASEVTESIPPRSSLHPTGIEQAARGEVARPAGRAQASPIRILTVQRTLAKLGYGPLQLNGIEDRHTQVAIEKFEQDWQLPITGMVSDTLVRELAAVANTSLD